MELIIPQNSVQFSKFKYILLNIVSIISYFFFIFCLYDKNPITINDFSLLKESSSLNKTSTVINKGENETLVVSYNPTDTSDDKTVTWSSSDPSVATVDSNGKVTALKAGNTTITATVGTFSKECAVEVQVPLTSVTINQDDMELSRGDNATLTVTYNPTDTTDDKTITWSSSDSSIATVDSNGKVIAVGAGEATITATVGSKKDTVKVTVVVPITSFTLTDTTQSEFELVKGKTATIGTTINPSDTTEDKTITWKSSNTSVATVDSNGKVTAVSAGTTTITGTLKNDMKVTSNEFAPSTMLFFSVAAASLPFVI